MFLPDYVKVKDKYLLCYFGFDKKCIKQLIYLRPLIEKEFHGLQIYLSFSDQMSHLLRDEIKIVKRNDINKVERQKYAYVRELKGDDIIDDFLKESDLCHFKHQLPN